MRLSRTFDLPLVTLLVPPAACALLLLDVGKTDGAPLQVLSLLIGAITVIGGQATVLQGAVHLVLFAAFIFLALVP